jgi:hypothetical protein
MSRGLVAACVDALRWPGGRGAELGGGPGGGAPGGSPARSPARSRGRGCWPICAVCWGSWSTRTAGRRPRQPARCPRTGCSGCCAPRTGTPTPVRDELRGYVVERLGPGGVLIVDQTGVICGSSAGPAPVGRRTLSPDPTRAATSEHHFWHRAGRPDGPSSATTSTAWCRSPLTATPVSHGSGPQGRPRVLEAALCPIAPIRGHLAEGSMNRDVRG